MLQSSADATEAPTGDPSGLKSSGWIPRSEMGEREWAAAGRRMSVIDRASQWWIGDWLRFGVARWGERYPRAARITGYDVPSLRNMAWMASEFDISRRRDTLTWSHHAAIAGLEPEERDIWLDRAERLRLSVSDLRGEVRAAQRGCTAARGAAGADETPPDDTRCPTCGQKLPQPQVTRRSLTTG